MASRKEFELLFQLKATLGSNFNSTFKTATDTTKTLQNTLSALNSTSGKISSFTKLEESIGKNKTKLEELNSTCKTYKDRLEELGERTDQNKEQYDDLTDKIRAKENQIRSTNDTIKAQEDRLSSLKKELNEAGVNTNNLTAENARLQKSYENVKKAQEDYAKVSKALEQNKAAISATKTELKQTAGTLAALGAAIAVPVKGAMEMESSMAEVAKVVDCIGNGEGASAEQIKSYQELQDGFYGLSRQIPMTAQEFAEIAAAAGQANVAMDNASLLQFAEDAAKMGVAFDTTADQAGDWMAKWRSSFGITQAEVVSLSDKINFLGNNSAANAQQISEIVTKIGPLGEVAGLANGEIAALGASLVGVGISEDVAATGIKKLMTTMTAGSAATKRQQTVLKQLGISATGLANRMQVDAQGAILDFLGAVKQLPEAEQAATLKNYFGEEAVASIAPLLTSLDALKDNFNMVGDASLYAGSMDAEYAARAATSENSFELMKNALKELSDTFGNLFMGEAEGAIKTLSEVIYKVTDFVKENPALIKSLVGAAAGFTALKAGALVGKLGFLEVKGGALEAVKSVLGFKSEVLTAAAEAGGKSGMFSSIGTALSKTFGSGKDSGGISGWVSGIKSSLSGLGGSTLNLFGGKDGALGNLLGNASSGASGVLSKITAPLSKIKDSVGGALGGIGTKITEGPLGKIGSVFSSLGNTVGSVVSGPLKLFGGMFSGLFTNAMPVIAIVSALSIALLKLSGEDISSFIQPFLDIFEQLKPVLSDAMEQFKQLGAEMLPLIMDAAKQLAPLLGQLATAIFPVILSLIQNIVLLIADLVRSILPVILNILTTVLPILTDIITTILPVIVTLMETLLPIITEFISSALSVVLDAVSELLPLLQDLANAVIPVLQSVVESLAPVIEFLAGVISASLKTAVENIGPILEGLKTIFQGIIDFITGVFTGDWELAWNGVKEIFGGIFDSLVALVKAPLNTIISAINNLTGGLGEIAIPDWVPIIGGTTFSIPQIPMLAKGSDYTPDTFIAGEAGAELITNAKGRKVFNAAETGRIFDNLQGGGITSGGEGYTIKIESSPVFNISGGNPDEIKALWAEHDEALLERVKNMFDNLAVDERRRAYV